MEKVDGNFATAVTCKRSWTHGTRPFRFRLRSAKMSMAMSIGARQRMEANRAATRVAAWEKGRKERKELKERAEIEANMRRCGRGVRCRAGWAAATRMAAAHRGRAARREAEYNRVLVNIRVVDRERKQRLPDSGRCYIVPTPSRGWRGWPSSTSTATARSRRRTSRSSTRAWRRCTRSVGCPAATEGRTPRRTCCCAVRWSTIRQRAKCSSSRRSPRGLASLLVNLKMVAKHKVRTHYETDARSR